MWRTRQPRGDASSDGSRELLPSAHELVDLDVRAASVTRHVAARSSGARFAGAPTAIRGTSSSNVRAGPALIRSSTSRGRGCPAGRAGCRGLRTPSRDRSRRSGVLPRKARPSRVGRAARDLSRCRRWSRLGARRRAPAPVSSLAAAGSFHVRVERERTTSSVRQRWWGETSPTRRRPPPVPAEPSTDSRAER